MTETQPSFVDLPIQQLRIWERGQGPTLLVLPGLIDSPQAGCAEIASAFPGHRVVALELPGLGASAASDTPTLEAIASIVDGAAARINQIAGVIAFDFSGAVALRCSIAKLLGQRVVLIDLPRAKWLAGHVPACGDFDLDPQGAHLYKLWAHLRDVDMLESFEPRRPRTNGTYKSAEALDETFLSFAVQPKAYEALWHLLGTEVRHVDEARLQGATVAASVGAVDPQTFSAPPLALEGQDYPAATSSAIKRGYADTKSGRMHYRMAGDGDSCVVALLAGPFSSSLLTPLLLELGGNHTVLAPDYIGQGDSCRSTQDTTIARAAAEIDEVTRELGWSRYSIYGTQTGAGVALEAAIAFPDRVKSVVIDSCSMQHASERVEHRARYFPTVAPDVWGSHLFQVWNILKDGEVFWPWYRPEGASAKESTSTGLGRLHDSVICTLRSRTTPVYKSMSSYEARNRVSEVHQPVLFVTGPKDIFKNYMPEAKRLAPSNFTFLDVPATVWAAKAEPENIKKTCDIYDAFFLANK